MQGLISDPILLHKGLHMVELNEANSPKETEKKSKARALLIGIIGALLLINGVLLYKYFKKSDEAEVVEKTLTNENIDLKSSLETAELLLIQYKEDSIALAVKNIELSEVLIEKKNEIANLIYKLRKKEKASAAELASLKSKISELQNQIIALETENSMLKNKNTILAGEKTELQGQNAQLETENNEISAEREKYKSVAQRLQAGNINIQTNKKRWIDKKEISTDRAKNVESIKISFNILENNMANRGKRMIYVKITGPNGVTITNPGNEGGTFAFENYESRYTYKMSTDFNKESKSGPTTVWRPKGELKEGKYIVEFYTEGYKMGVGSFTLI